MIRPINQRVSPRHGNWYALDRTDDRGEVLVVPSWLGQRMLYGSKLNPCAIDWHRRREHRARVAHRDAR
jgi:hypothetical protein